MIPNSCLQCGRQVDGEEPDGLCPSCLLHQALADDTFARADARCVSCDNALDPDARFCARCGTPVPASRPSTDDAVRQALEAKLAGLYRVLRLLGRGGMGAVYLARDLTLEREVAIKVVKPVSGGEAIYERFRREAKTAARLSHPNIVPLHAFGEVDGMPYFVMGYVRGESLADRLRREGKLPEEEARRILAEVADALDHAHCQGVVHRDVKPDNVLLEDASGRALLTDFGIARTVSHGETLTQYGSVVGTPQYMSPEQASGRGAVDGRSDIYSLGVMGYAMLAGRLPFEGSSVADTLLRQLTQDPPPLRSFVPSISDSTLQAIERCMEKDPARRWQDGRSLKQNLGTIEEDGQPDALQSVQGHGLGFAAIGLLILVLVWLVVVRLQHAPMAVLGLIATTLSAGYLAIVASLRFQGFPMALTQRVIWTEPSWWRAWYPRSLRRRGNVWDRLPASVRRLRTFLPIMLMAMAAVVAFITIASSSMDANKLITIALAFTLIQVTTTIVLEFAAKGEVKRLGIVSRADRDRIAFSAPPSRASFWNQPRIAVVLAPPGRVEPLRRSDSPRDQLLSILRLADELSGTLRPLGSEAADAARRLLTSIEQSETQIAELAQNLEPGEEQRLAEKVEALATVDAAAPMRALIEKQLELIRGLNARIEVAKESRNRHAEMLKTLALHLAALRARVAEAPSELRSLSDNVRALCDRIGQQGSIVPVGDTPTVKQERSP